MAATTEVSVSRPARLQHRRFPAAAVAIVLAVTAVLVFVAFSHALGPAPAGHRSGTPIVVPKPSPGPFGS